MAEEEAEERLELAHKIRLYYETHSSTKDWTELMALELSIVFAAPLHTIRDIRENVDVSITSIPATFRPFVTLAGVFLQLTQTCM